MKIKNCIITFLLTLVLLPSAYSNELWNKAVKLVNANSLMPGRVTKIEKIFNDGKVVQTEVTHMKVEKDSKGAYQLSLLKKTKDNKDITKKYLKSFEENEKQDFDFDLYYLFSPGTGKKVTYNKSGKTRKIYSYTCEEYNFTFTQDQLRIEGVIFLDTKSGFPLELKAKITSVPFKAKNIEVKDVEYTTVFTLTDNGKIYISNRNEKALFKISFWDFDLQSHTEYIYSDY